jgi:hypothetical protein
MSFSYSFEKQLTNLHILKIQLERLGLVDIEYISGNPTHIHIHMTKMLTEEEEIIMSDYITTYNDVDISSKELINLINTKLVVNSPNTYQVLASFDYKGLANQDISKIIITALGTYTTRIYDVTNHRSITISNQFTNIDYENNIIDLNQNNLPILNAIIEIQVKTTGQLYVKSLSVSG